MHRPYRRFRDGWDHDHCEFCGAKLAEAGSSGASEVEVLTPGFATTERHPRGADYYWVCEGCFRDFAPEFDWREAFTP